MAVEPDSADLLTVHDLTAAIDKAPEGVDPDLCSSIAKCLHDTGCLIVRDPRVPADHNDRFLDLLERYFAQPVDRKMEDCRPGLDYQVGVTPCGTEVPRCLVDPQMQDQLRKLQGSNQATHPTGPDLKWRFMWRLGQRPQQTQFPELHAEPVVPKGFPEWSAVMDSWGAALLGAATTVAGLLARGLGMQGGEIQELMVQGSHLLAPTGSDLDCNGRVGAVLAGYHYDLNLITVHGRSRFPGLYVWLRDGRRVAVRIPPGCLLMQAGKQLEWLTGGHIRAGMHEVVVTEATMAAVESARAEGRSTWRISSTVFTHCASDATLRPLGCWGDVEGVPASVMGGIEATTGEAYPPIKTGEQVQKELQAICLRKAVVAVATAGPRVGTPDPVQGPGAVNKLGVEGGTAVGSVVFSGSGENAPVGSGASGGSSAPSSSGSSCTTGIALAANR